MITEDENQENRERAVYRRADQNLNIEMRETQSENQFTRARLTRSKIQDCSPKTNENYKVFYCIRVQFNFS